MVYVLRETIDVRVSRCAADRDKASALCFSRRPLKTDPSKLAQVPALNFLMAVSIALSYCVSRPLPTSDGSNKLKDDFDG